MRRLTLGTTMGRMARRRLTALLFSSLLPMAAAPQLVAAQALVRPSDWHIRVGAAGALMLSSDQLGRLAYDKPGLLADVQLGYAVLPWLDVQVGTALGTFFSDQDNGGLAAPMVGALARIPDLNVIPYTFVDFGGAFTGALLLPMLRVGVGFDVPVNDSLRVGPVLAFGDVLFANDPGNSTDAQYVSIGLAAVYAHMPARPVPRKVVAKRPPPAAPRERVVVVRTPPEEIFKLIDRAIPGRTDQVELLAPVLFSFDSAELEPIGVAMLHEVARSLAERTDLELIEIRAYADARGSAEYNTELAGRRGQHVYDWLVEHGVDPARLSVAPVGANEFVESGEAETAHEQNRRVVFRVLRIKEKP